MVSVAKEIRPARVGGLNNRFAYVTLGGARRFQVIDLAFVSCYMTKLVDAKFKLLAPQI